MFKVVQTSELSGRVLDWTVAKASGLNIKNIYGNDIMTFCPRFSTEWEHGGPIIEREEIYARPTGDDAKWEAMVWRDTDSTTTCGFRHTMYGPTPLIAAMRCFVASKLGEVIDIPVELVDNEQVLTL